ncbi:MAG TPA: PilZ domain-containing protein [Steroidobacteraceae bacterium]|nr:PilZ domain-containing protein [Steroidobacteraceae bacterium]
MFDGSDTVVLYNELAYEEVLPVGWAPLEGSMDAAVAASVTERNVRLLQALAAIEDHGVSEKPDESAPDLTRLDFKINLLLDLVGQLVVANRPRPAAVAIRFNSQGALWHATGPLPQAGSQGVAEIHLRDFLAEPLRLVGTLTQVSAAGDVTVRFAPVGEPLADLLERLIFRHHRRQVAGIRQPRRD